MDTFKSDNPTQGQAGLEAYSESSAIAHVSHEMRSPIHVILGMVELLESEGDLSTQQKNRLGTIGRVADSLSLMLDDLLDFSKISAGQMELDSQPFSPAAVADSVGRSFDTEAVAKQLQFSVIIDPNVPLKVLGDENRLRQVLTNLVSNAIKYTDSGFVRLDLFSGKAGTIRFKVEDSGPGIPEDAQANIFKPYQQAKISHSNKGTGLGLAIAYKLVEQMEGELQYTTSTKGTTFWFEIPLMQARRSTDYEPDQPLPSGSGRVLVVDDSPVNRMLATSQLERLGYTAVAASGGEEALELMKSEPYDAVLMDWHMPGMDGLQATEAWRSSEKQRSSEDETNPMPIVMVTASAMSGDREACLAAGASDYLTKPTSTGDLAAVLNKWIQPENASPEAEAASDIELIDRLVDQLGSKEVALSILEAYLSTLPEYVQAVISGRDAEDSKSIARAAHTIRPAASMIGESQLAETCEKLETGLADGMSPEWDENVENFLVQCDESADRIGHIVEQLQQELQT